MNACRSVLEGLAEAATGHVPPERWVALRAHLRTCAGCLKRWREIQETVAWLRDLPDPQPPESFWDEIQSKVGRTGVAPRPWRVAGAAILVGALLLVLKLPGNQPAPDRLAAVMSDAVREVMPELVRLTGRWGTEFQLEEEQWWVGSE